MRILLLFLSLFLLLACDPKKNTNPTSPLPTVNERIGIYKNATIYTGRSDYEFEIDGQATLIRMSNFDTLHQPTVPSNLTVLDTAGFPVANPLLIGKKYVLAFAPQEQLKSIQLVGAQVSSSAEFPAIPENYSGLLSVNSSVDSRAYLSLFSDLSAILLVNYDSKERPMYRQGRWTRTDKGQKIKVQFDDENWDFLVKENALVLTSDQMGKERLSLMATEKFDICHYVKQWLSTLSATDGQTQIATTFMSPTSPLATILRTEHAYMELYGELEEVYKLDEVTISKVLRANPTIQGVCDLLLRTTEKRH